MALTFGALWFSVIFFPRFSRIISIAKERLNRYDYGEMQQNFHFPSVFDLNGQRNPNLHVSHWVLSWACFLASLCYCRLLGLETVSVSSRVKSSPASEFASHPDLKLHLLFDIQVFFCQWVLFSDSKRREALAVHEFRHDSEAFSTYLYVVSYLFVLILGHLSYCSLHSSPTWQLVIAI